MRDVFLNVGFFRCQNLHEQHFSQTISKNFNFEVDHSPQRGQEVKYIDFQLQDQHSSSTESTSLSHKELTAMGKTSSQDQCASSDSGNNSRSSSLTIRYISSLHLCYGLSD